jgi:hypothetical protein
MNQNSTPAFGGRVDFYHLPKPRSNGLAVNVSELPQIRLHSSVEVCEDRLTSQ